MFCDSFDIENIENIDFTWSPNWIFPKGLVQDLGQKFEFYFYFFSFYFFFLAQKKGLVICLIKASLCRR